MAIATVATVLLVGNPGGEVISARINRQLESDGRCVARISSEVDDAISLRRQIERIQSAVKHADVVIVDTYDQSPLTAAAVFQSVAERKALVFFSLKNKSGSWDQIRLPIVSDANAENVDELSYIVSAVAPACI